MVGASDHPPLPRPNCSFHLLYRQKVIAVYEGMTTEGVPAYMCDDCFIEFGIGITSEVVRRLDDSEGLFE